MKRFRKSQLLLALTVLLIFVLTACNLVEEQSIHWPRFGSSQEEQSGEVSAGNSSDNSRIVDIGQLEVNNPPVYDGNNYVKVNGNVPAFTKSQLDSTGAAYEKYGELDALGRCTGAYGCFGRETMPAEGEERGDIASVHPTGWLSGQGWERCHLIAWSISAENANERNLITGTHYLNYDGMRPFEEEIQSYLYGKNRHVLYEVTPVYEGENLVASGVHMQAMSVEDNGKGISFNVYCFNVTPNATIDYRTGVVTTEEQATREARLYVVNKRSGVFHYPSCEGAQSISEKNRMEVTATRVELTEQGYKPCGYCQP